MMNVLIVLDNFSLVQICSTLICTLLGIRLILPPYYKTRSEYKNVRPTKYITARRALGIAYMIIGGLTIVQMFLGPTRPPYKETDIYPVIGLLISTSQIVLFTVAVLSLFNSKLIKRDIILANISPIVILFVATLLFKQESNLQRGIRMVLFCYYVLQLIVYTFIFFIERRKYLNLIEDYFGLGKQYDFYKCKGVVAIYICSLFMGFYALWSYFFTTLLQNIIFTAIITVFYTITAIYFLWYSKHSQRIQDVTSPESWKMTEEYSRKYRKAEKGKRR